MSHDTFPDAAGSSPSATGSNENRVSSERIITTSRDTDAELRRKWFDDAQRNGWTFVYFPDRNTAPHTPRKMLIVAEGIESATVLRILVDETAIHAE